MEKYLNKKCIIMIMMLFSLSVYSQNQEFKSEGITYRVLTDKTAAVTFFSNDADPRIPNGGDNDDATFDSKRRRASSSPSPYSVTIPEQVSYNGTPLTVVSIDPSAFESCSHLSSLTLPATLISIGDNAFSGCTSLTSITCPVKTPISIPANVFTGVTQSNCTLTVYASSQNKYKSASVWQDFRFATMPDPYTLGDVNRDGKVSISDLHCLVAILNGSNTSSLNLSLDAADLNTNGQVSFDDLPLLLHIILTK